MKTTEPPVTIPRPQSFVPQRGEAVLYQGQRCHIREILDMRRCILQPDQLDARPLAANLSELRPVPEAIVARDSMEAKSLEGISEKHLAIARHRLEMIRPLVQFCTWQQIKEVANANELHPTTIYRFLVNYRRTGMLISLVPGFERRGAPLKTRLSKEQEDEVTAVIEGYYLKPQRPELTAAHEELEARCRELRIPVPSLSTLHNRLKAISQRRKTRERNGKGAARAFDPVRGSLPGADGPWSIILIDHTVVDLQLVDRETRQLLGRPYITLAEDAATRMVVGFYLSLDHPSGMAVGMCLARAMLPKETWLERLKVSGEWPVWGKPKVVHVDNGDGFRGDAVRNACKELDFNIHFRRAGRPQDGGTLERLIGTLMREIHRVPGTTFSNPQERGEYKSENKAAVTLDELERYVAEWIVNIYHQKGHRGLRGKSPIQAWNEGFLGTSELPGLGLPERHVSEEHILMHFLPSVQRTVQTYGLEMWYIKYWSDHLQHWIKAKTHGNPTVGRKFTVRYDPRNLSRVWFRDPDLNSYIEVPYRDATRPSIDYWELQKINTKLRKENGEDIDEELIFHTRNRLRQLVSQSEEDTKAARMEREKQRRRAEAAGKFKTKPTQGTTETTVPPPSARGKVVDPRTLAYDDIEN